MHATLASAPYEVKTAAIIRSTTLRRAVIWTLLHKNTKTHSSVQTPPIADDSAAKYFGFQLRATPVVRSPCLTLEQ
jgi:hypothetical protein